jgi:hypothetical protein
MAATLIPYYMKTSCYYLGKTEERESTGSRKNITTFAWDCIYLKSGMLNSKVLDSNPNLHLLLYIRLRFDYCLNEPIMQISVEAVQNSSEITDQGRRWSHETEDMYDHVYSLPFFFFRTYGFGYSFREYI